MKPHSLAFKLIPPSSSSFLKVQPPLLLVLPVSSAIVVVDVYLAGCVHRGLVTDVYQVNGEKPASGLFFGQSSFSSIALVRGTSVVNVEQSVKDEEELKLFAPMGCAYQTGAGAVTNIAGVGKKDSHCEWLRLNSC